MLDYSVVVLRVRDSGAAHELQVTLVDPSGATCVRRRPSGRVEDGVVPLREPAAEICVVH